MRRFNSYFACFLVSLSFSVLQAAIPIDGKMLGDNIDISANQVTFDNKTGLLNASGDVLLISGAVKINCEKAVVSQATGDFEAFGKVTITQNDNYWEGEKVTGNYNKQIIDTGSFFSKHGPVYLKSGNAHHYAPAAYAETVEEKKMAGKTEITDAVLSTCDYLAEGHQHYTLEASRVVIDADGYFKAYNVVFKVGGVPFFYLPVLWTKDSKGVGIESKFGYKGRFGAFLSLEKPMQINDNVTTNWLVDFYSKRGVGGGNETNIVTTNSRTNIFVYGINDQDAPETNELVKTAVTGPGVPPPFPSVGYVQEEGYNKRFEKVEKRYRLKLSHHSDITDELALDVNLDRLSDIDMLEDWFEAEYDNTFQPVSNTSLNFLNENLHFSLSVRPQLNDFYNVVEKMPEFRADFLRTELGDSGIFYQGDMTIAEMKMQWREADRERPVQPSLVPLEDLEDYSALRFDTMHSFYMPMNYNNWLNIIPRAGVRATYYSDSSEEGVSIGDLNNNFDVANPDNVTGEEVVKNYDNDGGELWRVTGEVGLEMSLKKYRTWQDYKNDTLRLDGLRHIVEPYINFTSIFNPTESKDNIYFFDETDRIDELNFVRIGAKQRFQTRRNKEIYTFASIENYADFHATTRDNIKNLGDFATMIKVNPDEELTIWTRMMIAMDGANINEFELGTKFGSINSIETSISYLYRDDYNAAPVYSMNSYLADYGSNSYFERSYEHSHSLNVSFSFPINAKTRGKIGYLFDIEDRELVEQYYELQRDMHCWIGALRIGWDDGDFEAMVMFYLKAFPRLNLGSDGGESDGAI